MLTRKQRRLAAVTANFMPTPNLWTLSSACHGLSPIPDGVMLCVPIGGRKRHIAPAAVVLPGSTALDRRASLTDAFARQLWDAWIRKGCRPLKREDVEAIRLARILLTA